MRALFLILICFGFTINSDVNIKVESFDAFSKRCIESPSNDTIYFINFWATWCKPCVAELPYIEKVNGALIDSTPIKTIMVSLDHYTSLKTRVKPFLASKNYSSEQILLKDGNSNEWIDKLDSSWTGAIPATLILKNGKRGFHEGMFRSAKHILKTIKKI